MKYLNWQKVTLQLTWMSFLQNRNVCFNQERLPITNRNFRHKSLVRPKIKSPNWQGSQPISYLTKLSHRDNIYQVGQKYKITYQNILGKLRSDRFLYHEMPKMAKITLRLTWTTFLQNREVCFNQESLPITYHNFRHKSLIRLKSKSPNWHQLISYKANFSRKESMHLIDVKLNITYQNNQGVIQVTHIFPSK